jgi:hypothetical protein
MSAFNGQSGFGCVAEPDGVASVPVFKAEATDWLRGDRQQPSGLAQRVFYFGTLL